MNFNKTFAISLITGLAIYSSSGLAYCNKCFPATFINEDGHDVVIKFKPGAGSNAMTFGGTLNSGIPATSQIPVCYYSADDYCTSYPVINYKFNGTLSIQTGTKAGVNYTHTIKVGNTSHQPSIILTGDDANYYNATGNTNQNLKIISIPAQWDSSK